MNGNFFSVIIESDFGASALDFGTVIFNQNRKALGQIFDTFGSVTRPMYAIRFNSAEEIEALGLNQPKLPVYFAPEAGEFTIPIFTDALRNLKGSDASWEDNHEVPAEV